MIIKKLLQTLSLNFCLNFQETNTVVISSKDKIYLPFLFSVALCTLFVYLCPLSGNNVVQTVHRTKLSIGRNLQGKLSTLTTAKILSTPLTVFRFLAIPRRRL